MSSQTTTTFAPAAIIAIVALFAATGCVEEAGEAASNLGSSVEEGANSAVDTGRAAIEDKIDCSGIVREETRLLVTDLIETARDDIEALPTSTGELARIAGAIALSRDSTKLLVGNVAALMQKGHFPQANAGKWDELSCDDVDSFECVDAITGQTGGSGQTRVVCADGAPATIEASFGEGCQLFGTQNTGGLSLARDGQLAFDALALGSVAQADGRVSFEMTTGEVSTFLADTAGEPFTIASNAGKSCESRLTFQDIALIDDPESLSAEFDVARTKDEQTVRVRTLQGPAVWSHARSCSCPLPGAALEVEVGDFLGTGQPGTFQVAYADATDSCAMAEVSVVSWPSACDGEMDCGRAAIESLLSRVVSTSCVD